MRTKRIMNKVNERLEQQTNKKIHTFSLNPDVVTQFKKSCVNKYSMSSVVEELMKAFIETRGKEGSAT